jgi:N-dimethylarginine dimethylaminohydrolase
MRRQSESIAAFFESQGITVHLHPAPHHDYPNYIFLRDLFFMTPEGAILARPASAQRAGEERSVCEALARLGIPILASLHGHALFEGADALWLAPNQVLIGVGRRTNREGALLVARVLRSLDVRVRRIAMPRGVQHLLGLVNFVDFDLAAVDRERAPAPLKRLLREEGVTLIEAPHDEELADRRGMNFVTLGPRSLVMPSGCPRLRRRLETAGIETHELEIGEYLKAAGGLACLTGIIARDRRPNVAGAKPNAPPKPHDGERK